MAGPGYLRAADAAGRGHLRASHADREQTVDVLKAAFVQGRLTKDEFDARIGQTLASRTYAELATVTADIPAGLARARPPSGPPRQTSGAARWGISGLITPAILVGAFVFGSLSADGGYGAVACRDRIRLFHFLAVRRGRYALAMALYVFVIGKNMRPMRAHGRIAPRARVLRNPGGFGEIETLPVHGLRSARAVTEDRRLAASIGT